MPALAELRLSINQRGAELFCVVGDKVTQEEQWSFGRSIGKAEARELVEALFQNGFDVMQFWAHGPSDE
jgi:hypothetical protein